MESANKLAYKTFFYCGDSLIEADICRKCGHILSLRVKNPEKLIQAISDIVEEKVRKLPMYYDMKVGLIMLLLWLNMQNY